MFFMTKRAFCRWLNFCAFAFVIFAAPPKHAFAQFPGVGSEAPSGVAAQADYDGVSSGGNSAENSISDAGNSDTDGSKSGVNNAVSGRSDSDDNDFDYHAPSSRFSTSLIKKGQHRKQLFIKKLSLEFAAIEFFERKTGLPFSRDDVPRYLDELLIDLKTIAGKEKKGAIVKEGVRSIALDAYHIETQLNQHLDQLLDHLGQPVPKKPFFAIMPVLPKTSGAAEKKLNALALKFELADYGEKVLQAMEARRY